MSYLTEIVSRVQQRGYWYVIVRPASVRTDLLAFTDLDGLVRDVAVSRRNWGPLPWLAHPAIQGIRGTDWVGGGVEADVIRQAWQLYQSGQFRAVMGVFEDWRDESAMLSAGPEWRSGQVLPVSQTIVQISYAYEFAGRLASRLLSRGVDQLSVEVTLKNVQSRALLSDRGLPFMEVRRGPEEDIVMPHRLIVSELIAEWNSLAIGCSLELFARFGWRPTPQMIRDLQAEGYQ